MLVIEDNIFSSNFYINDEYVSIPVGSRAFVYNALFAYAVGIKLGISSDRVDAMFYNFVQSVDDFGDITKHSLISSYNRYR